MRRRIVFSWLKSVLSGNIDEFLLLTALILIAIGCWLVWRPGSFLIPGAVLLYIALPTRRPFVQRPPVPVRRR